MQVMKHCAVNLCYWVTGMSDKSVVQMLQIQVKTCSGGVLWSSLSERPPFSKTTKLWAWQWFKDTIMLQKIPSDIRAQTNFCFLWPYNFQFYTQHDMLVANSGWTQDAESRLSHGRTSLCLLPQEWICVNSLCETSMKRKISESMEKDEMIEQPSFYSAGLFAGKTPRSLLCQTWLSLRSSTACFCPLAFWFSSLSCVHEGKCKLSVLFTFSDRLNNDGIILIRKSEPTVSTR